jgi:hypothetical protein
MNYHQHNHKYDPYITSKFVIDTDNVKDDKDYMKERLNKFFGSEVWKITRERVMQKNKFKIDKVYFNEPYVIVIWADKTKTTVKIQDGDVYDPEKGLAMAISKRALGTNESGSNYYDEFKKWLPEEPPVNRKVKFSIPDIMTEGVPSITDAAKVLKSAADAVYERLNEIHLPVKTEVLIDEES